VYAAHGYPDAKLTRFAVEVRHPDRKVKRQRAYVTIAVDEGQPTTIERVRHFVFAQTPQRQMGSRPSKKFDARLKVEDGKVAFEF
jgi:hypothetical protein